MVHLKCHKRGRCGSLGAYECSANKDSQLVLGTVCADVTVTKFKGDVQAYKVSMVSSLGLFGW